MPVVQTVPTKICKKHLTKFDTQSRWNLADKQKYGCFTDIFFSIIIMEEVIVWQKHTKNVWKFSGLYWSFKLIFFASFSSPALFHPFITSLAFVLRFHSCAGFISEPDCLVTSSITRETLGIYFTLRTYFSPVRIRIIMKHYNVTITRTPPRSISYSFSTEVPVS